MFRGVVEAKLLHLPLNLGFSRVRLGSVEDAEVAISGINGVDLIDESCVGLLDGTRLKTGESWEVTLCVPVTSDGTIEIPGRLVTGCSLVSITTVTHGPVRAVQKIVVSVIFIKRFYRIHKAYAEANDHCERSRHERHGYAAYNNKL